MGGIPTSLFDASLFKPAKRYEAFRESMGVIFEVSNPQRKAEEFAGRIGSQLVGELMLVDCETVGQRFLRTPGMFGRDDVDHILIQAYQYGYNRLGDGRVIGRESGLMIIDASRPWDAVTSAFRNLTLVVPRRLLAGKLLNENDHHGTTLGADQPFSRLLLEYMLSLRSTLSMLSVEQAEGVAEPVLDLVAAAMNDSSPTKKLSTSGKVARNFALKVRIKRYIEANLHDPTLGHIQLIARFQVSGSVLEKLFREEGGVFAYLNRRRLENAKGVLSRPGSCPAIPDLAESVGFRNEKTFANEYERRFGPDPGLHKEEGGRSQDSRLQVDPSAGLIWGGWFLGLK